MDVEHRNTISLAAAKARISARYSGGVENAQSKLFNDGMGAIGLIDEQNRALNEQISLIAQNDPKSERIVELKQQIDANNNHKQTILNNPDFREATRGNLTSQTSYRLSGGKYETEQPKTEEVVPSAPTRPPESAMNYSGSPKQVIAQAQQQINEENHQRSAAAYEEQKKRLKGSNGGGYWGYFGG